MKTNIILTLLALVTILAFYLLNDEIEKTLVEIEEQETKIERETNAEDKKT